MLIIRQQGRNLLAFYNHAVAYLAKCILRYHTAAARRQLRKVLYDAQNVTLLYSTVFMQHTFKILDILRLRYRAGCCDAYRDAYYNSSRRYTISILLLV
jgi:hypothetical protein